MPNLPGFGDEATWPEYSGHPNDPRRDNSHEFADDHEDTPLTKEEAKHMRAYLQRFAELYGHTDPNKNP